jgi:GxxExxY protein
MSSVDTEQIAAIGVDAAYVVYRELGPGLLESIYEECLAVELSSRRVRFSRQVAVPIDFRGKRLDVAFRADMILGGQVLFELKAIESLLPVHKAQAITYLKLLRLPLGFLINFNVALFKNGIQRVINSPRPPM